MSNWKKEIQHEMVTASESSFVSNVLHTLIDLVAFYHPKTESCLNLVATVMGYGF